jgi:DNA-binding NarL/FixJ family response regulator
MADQKVVTLLLADDHAVVRLGLRRLLEAEPDFRVVGEVDDGLQVLPEVERLRPDVLLLDLVMPSLNGLEVILQVRKHAPETRVVVLSMHANEAYVFGALRNGAAAYVLKGANGPKLVEAIRTVLPATVTSVRRCPNAPYSRTSTRLKACRRTCTTHSPPANVKSCTLHRKAATTPRLPSACSSAGVP